MMKRLDGKVAVVTSGNNGIGLATARRFQQEGGLGQICGLLRQESFQRA